MDLKKLVRTIIDGAEAVEQTRVSVEKTEAKVRELSINAIANLDETKKENSNALKNLEVTKGLLASLRNLRESTLAEVNKIKKVARNIEDTRNKNKKLYEDFKKNRKVWEKAKEQAIKVSNQSIEAREEALKAKDEAKKLIAKAEKLLAKVEEEKLFVIRRAEDIANARDQVEQTERDISLKSKKIFSLIPGFTGSMLQHSRVAPTKKNGILTGSVYYNLTKEELFRYNGSEWKPYS